MTGIASWAMSLAMLASFALVIGGVVLFRREGERKKGILMFVAATVLIGNVAILAA